MYGTEYLAINALCHSISLFSLMFECKGIEILGKSPCFVVLVFRTQSGDEIP